MKKDRENFRHKITNEFEWFFAILAFCCVAAYFSVGPGGWNIENAGARYNLDFKTLAMLLCGFIYSIIGFFRLKADRFNNKISGIFYLSALVLSIVVFLAFTWGFHTFAEAHKSYTVYPPVAGKPRVESALYPPFKAAIFLLYSWQAIMALGIVFTVIKLLKKRK